MMQPPSSSAAGRSTAPGAQIVVLTGTDTGRRYTVEERVTIGRADAQVLLFDDEVSRQHAEIVWEGRGGYWIRDLGSRNGTFVNGTPVDASQLNGGDEIGIGGVRLAFRDHDPLEEELLSRQRLETLGRLGAGVAHDFNNVVGAVLGNVEYLRSLLQDRGQLDRGASECISDILDALGRAASLTPRLLRIARQEERRSSRVSMTELCGEIVKLMRRTFDRSIVIEEALAPEVTVQGDPVALHQVVMNLCLNARDAMVPGGGTLRLEVLLRTPAEMPDDPTFSQRPAVVVTVTDTGTGMDEYTLGRVFERFFTTKSKGAGYGIGLSTTRELVLDHGGRIEVKSELGTGSAFRVLLPAAPPERATRRAQPTPLLAPEVLMHRRGVRGKVLVIDDEEMIRRMLERSLGRAGYDVLSAADGERALELYRSARPEPDVVLLDIDMPKATGEQVQRSLRAEFPGARVIVLSGHADVGRERTLLAEGALGVLRKPVRLETLLAEIGRVAQSPPSAAPVEVDEDVTIDRT